jgi:hypothetical protein
MAYSVKVSVPDQDGYKVSGSSSTIVGNLEKGDYTIASFNVASTQSAGEAEGDGGGVPPDSAKAGSEGENVTSTSMDSNPLKVQIEYTDAKGERITVDKEVELEMTSGNMTAAGQAGPGRSAGIGSYLLYIVVIVLAGGAFVYRKKVQEKIQARKGNQSGNKKSENQKD